MIELGLMTEYGHAAIEQAKAAGTWQLLPDESRLAMPDDLQEQRGSAMPGSTGLTCGTVRSARWQNATRTSSARSTWG
jgi:hypothetical protein